MFVFKALGVQSDQEIMLLVAGMERDYQELFSINFDESSKQKIYSQQQALEFIGARIRNQRRPIGTPGPRRSYVQEGLEALASVFLPHVPVSGLNFKPKVLYFAYMTRRVLMAMNDSKLVDDRDYVGNKRLELYILPLLPSDGEVGLTEIGPDSCCRSSLRISSRNSITI